MDNNKFLEIRSVSDPELFNLKGWEFIEVREVSTVLHLSVEEVHPHLKENPHHYEKTITTAKSAVGTELRYIFGRRRDSYIESLQETAQNATSALREVSEKLKGQITELEEKAKENLRKFNEANAKASQSESELKRSREQEKALQNDNKSLVQMCRDAEDLVRRARSFFGDREWALFEKQVETDDKAKETEGGKVSS